MRSALRRAVGAALLSAAGLAPFGCRVLSASSPGRSDALSASGASAPRVELREAEDRPPIGLVARTGDPFPAMAVAVAHDFGSEASLALAALLESRLRAAGFAGAEARAHALGLQAFTLLASPDEAARFIGAVRTALRTPFAAADPAAPAVQKRVQSLRARSISGAAEVAVNECAGELGVAEGKALLDVATPAGVARVEGFRRRVVSTKTVGFAALGPSVVLEAAASAIEDGEEWPSDAAVEDPWPARDVIGVEPASDRERRLSVALRVADADAAIESARTLAHASSALAQRLEAFDPPWSVERVIGAARPRGACLRIDLGAPSGDPGPRSAEVARAAVLVLEEADIALRSAPRGGFLLEDSVLRPSDPREAAAVAAWRAVTGRLPAGPERRLLSFATRANEAGAASSRELIRAVEEAQTRARRSTLEQRARLEAGQGEIWALLASPCGTRSETRTDAGISAVIVHAIASQRARIDDVTLEPWVTPDGVGLLAHAARRGPDENPAALARRVGSALGRALVARLQGSEIARARERLLDALGPGPRPGFWLALESVATDHPSWLEPRGSFGALSEAGSHAAEAKKSALVQGPLRLAVLANATHEQAEATAGAAERWLRSLRSEPTRCPTAVRAAARVGEMTLETTDAEHLEAHAYLAVPLPPAEIAASRDAEWTVFLMNRRGGWLDQALRLPGLASSARALVLGGGRGSALVVEIHALDGKQREAVAQVRGLFDRLSRGGASDADAEAARRAFQHLDRVAMLDPRRRIVDVWRGAAADTRADLASLRRLHTALRPDAHAVVYMKTRD